MSRATRDAAAAAEIRFVDKAYATEGATAFALRNADRVKSLGPFKAPDFDSIQPYSQLQDLELKVETDGAKIALLPCSLRKLLVELPISRIRRIDWKTFRPLCSLQVLKINPTPGKSFIVIQLDDSFATALPLLRVFHVEASWKWLGAMLITTAKVAMPHLVEVTLSWVTTVDLDLRFMSALESLSLHHCNVCVVSAACCTMVLDSCWARIFWGMVLVTPHLRSLTTNGGGLYMLDGSRCRNALSILCMHSSIEWVGAKPKIENLEERLTSLESFLLVLWRLFRICFWLLLQVLWRLFRTCFWLLLRVLR